MDTPPVRRLLPLLAIVVLLVSGTMEARSESVQFAEIRPQPLAQALTAFARQTGLQIIYLSDLVTARQSKGARAGLSPSDALTQLLDGTGLAFELLNARTVKIFAVAPAPTVTPMAGTTRSRAPSFRQREEIIVTGPRGAHGLGTAADIRSVAASVSIVSGGTLESQKLEQLSDYAAYLPGVNVVGFGSPGFGAVILRGITSFPENATGAFYLDDVPMGPNGPWADACCEVLDLMPYDLERVEVRRGPQGTHYGANSQSGLIRYVLTEPSVGGFEARVGADGSRIYGASGAGASLRVMVNAPIVEDVLAVRVSAYGSYRPGFIDNAYSGASDINAVRQSGERFSLLWRPAASVAVKVTAFWPRIDADSEAVTSSAGVTIVPDTGDANIVKATGSHGDLAEYHAFQAPFGKSIDYYAATVNWNPGSFEILSATAWSRTRSHSASDHTLFLGGSFPEWSDGAVPAGLALFNRHIDFEKFTEELHVVSTAGRQVAWLLGGFYTHESATDKAAQYAFDNNYQPIAAFAPAISNSTSRSTFDEWAAFGELTWHVTDHLDLTGGIRFDHNDQQFTRSEGGSVAGSAYITGESVEDVTNWMVAASYRFTPAVTFYSRVATGSQPGSPNNNYQFVMGEPVTPPEELPLTVAAETVTNYEVGLKSEFLDHAALLDLTVFYINWNDIQLGMFFGDAFGWANAGKATSQGVELTSSYVPLSGLRLGYGAAYTHSELTTVSPGAEYMLPGYQLADIPRWSMAFTTDYDWALTDVWDAHVGGAWRWIDKRWDAIGVQSRSAGGGPTMEMPSYSVLDLHASIARGPLMLRAFVRNFTDTRANLHSFVQGDPANPPASVQARILQPRTIGVGFDYAF